jgi:ATP-dependent Clp protease ATP-binding subunit ClpC
VAALDLSPGTKKVLELAVDEARRMGHHYIGTEHLLLGLVRQAEDGVAIDVLKSPRRKCRKKCAARPAACCKKALLQTTQSKPAKNPALSAHAISDKDPAGRPTRDRPDGACPSEGKLDPVVGRETEIERVIQVL